MGRAALANNPRDLLWLAQTCQTLYSKIETARLLAEARRLCWLPDLTSKQIHISDQGRTLSVACCDDSIEPWVCGRLLPTAGTSAWQVHVDRSRCNDGNGMSVGVCNAEARCCWGVFLYSGRLRCISRDADGKVDYEPPPKGYPNGNYTTVVMKDGAGQRTNLTGKANGATIEVSIDHDAGTLGYRINGGPYLVALPLDLEDENGNSPKKKKKASGAIRTFPQGAALRPYASCYYVGDRLSFVATHL
eukprot:COSAG05_NODE_535_length_8871_cov_311.345759_2_plen_247_part_00